MSFIVCNNSKAIIKSVGRIFSDEDGPLTATSTSFVDSDETRIRIVQLHLSQLKSVAIFPGQVVMVAGFNPRGDRFIVNEIITEQHLDPVKPIKRPFSANEQLTFLVAAGLFTNEDDFHYKPLHSLLSHLRENKTDVVVLLGPFINDDHQLINEDIATSSSFNTFFEQIIDWIMDAAGTDTSVLIVSSYQDIIAEPVYPTAPYELLSKYKNLQFLPDPSMIDIEGIIMAMTSVDVVNHLIKCELAL